MVIGVTVPGAASTVSRAAAIAPRSVEASA
jgi:hypothetical protein